ncbi:MAG: lipid A biosynthesis lauroyl acyltransferase, partial [Xanthobacteraceae bacterium]
MNDVTAGSTTADEFLHSVRRNIFSSEQTYRLVADGLECRDGSSTRIIPYRDIVEIHEYKSKVWGRLSAQLPRRFDYVLRCRDGEKIALNSIHRRGLRVVENRLPSCVALVTQLRERVAAANPDVKSFNKLSWPYRLANAADRAVYRVGLLFFKLIRLIDFDRAANVAAWMLRRIGPWLRGHRTARASLTAAYPEKSPAEIEGILAGMWENLGRLAVEYIDLDRLVDPANPNGGRIVVAPGTLETLARIRDDGKTAVLFTSHLASYEVGATWVVHSGLDLVIVYNPVNFGPVAEQLVAMRKKTMGRLVLSGRDAVWKLREAMKEGLHLTLFADQHFANGVDVTFFGRSCKANPMLVRFAQLFECPVHGFRAVRLPGNRFQLEFTEELVLPRGSGGKIDTGAAMQMITTTIEGWVREHPEQWLWLQR